mmetsp:Transcript_8507/g.16741  ORF Transcript_8507/g.16741 Transcript_8507/m.16741 type:complete len:210 (-) Transcript_8507:194-823(-)
MGNSKSQIGEKLFKEFDEDKNDIIDKKELDKLISALAKAKISEDFMKLLMGAAVPIEYQGIELPKTLEDLVKVAHLKKQLDGIKKAASSLEKLLELDIKSDEAVNDFATKAGLKPGHMARLKRVMAVTKGAIAAKKASLGFDEDGDGMIEKTEFMKKLKEAKISEDDAKKIEATLDELANKSNLIEKFPERPPRRAYIETKGGCYGYGY